MTFSSAIPFPPSSGTKTAAPALSLRRDTSKGAQAGTGKHLAEQALVQESLDFRQLRHHTRNALQSIIAHVSKVPGVQDSPQGERLLEEVVRRICLSATISNSLFGFSERPGTMEERLHALGQSMIGLFCDTGQSIRLIVEADPCPTHLQEPVLRVAHELVGNALKHGMHLRLLGCVTIRLRRETKRLVLSVIDDGWGFPGTPKPGDGMGLAMTLAADQGGTIRLRRSNDRTVAELELPCHSTEVFAVTGTTAAS